MPKTVPSRSKLDRKFTWNAESVFPSNEAWEKEVNQILGRFHPDVVSIRRDLFDLGFLDRRNDGSDYWRRGASTF